MPLSLVRDHYSDFVLFSLAGVRYYLPAYLLASLDDLDLQFFVLAGLLLDEPQEDKYNLRDWTLKRFGVLAPAEKAAVRAFLEYVRDESPDDLFRENAAKALERYWAT